MELACTPGPPPLPRIRVVIADLSGDDMFESSDFEEYLRARNLGGAHVRSFVRHAEKQLGGEFRAPAHFLRLVDTTSGYMLEPYEGILEYAREHNVVPVETAAPREDVRGPNELFLTVIREEPMEIVVKNNGTASTSAWSHRQTDPDEYFVMGLRVLRQTDEAGRTVRLVIDDWSRCGIFCDTMCIREAYSRKEFEYAFRFYLKPFAESSVGGRESLLAAETDRQGLNVLEGLLISAPRWELKTFRFMICLVEILFQYGAVAGLVTQLVRDFTAETLKGADEFGPHLFGFEDNWRWKGLSVGSQSVFRELCQRISVAAAAGEQ